MAYTYVFQVESSGTLNPGGSTISGSTNIAYSNAFYTYCPQGGVTLFSYPEDGTTFSGINSCYDYPINGTNAITQNPECTYEAIGLYDYKVSIPISYINVTPAYLFTLPVNSKIISIESEMITSFSGGYRQDLTLYSGFQNEAAGVTYISGDKLLNGEYITHVGCNIYDPHYNDPTTFNLTIKICEQTSASGFNLTDILSATHSGTGQEWFKLTTPIKIPESGDYSLGVYSSSVLYGFSCPMENRHSYSKVGDCSGTCDDFLYESSYYHSCTAYYTPSYSIGTLSDSDLFLHKLNIVENTDQYCTSGYVESNTGVYLNSTCFHPDTVGSGILTFNCRQYVPITLSGSNVVYPGNFQITSDSPSNTLSGNVVYYLYSKSLESSIVEQVSEYVDNLYSISYNYDCGISGSFPIHSCIDSIETQVNEYMFNPEIDISGYVLVISFRKETNLIEYSIITAETYYSIIKCFSGFMGKAANCWSCDYFLYCGCDVKGSINIMSFKKDAVTMREYLLDYLSFLITDYNVNSHYACDSYRLSRIDYNSPYISDMSPPGNSILNDRFLNNVSDEGKIIFNLRDASTSVSGLNTNIWIKRQDYFTSSTDVYDNFSFYTNDYKTTTSGYGWNTFNATKAYKFITNENYINLQSYLDRIYHRTDSICNISGTNALEITTSGNTALTSSPMLYWTIPSGYTTWSMDTKLQVYRDTLNENQWAGIGISTSPTVTSGNYIYLMASTTSGGRHIIINSSTPSYTTSGVRPYPDPYEYYLRMDRTGNSLSCKWSIDKTNWTTLKTVTLTEYSSDLYVGPLVINTNTNNSKTTAYFDYIHINCSGVNNFISSTDSWELLTFQGSQLNNTSNTGTTIFSKMNNLLYNFSYELEESLPLEPNEQVYIRIETSDKKDLQLQYTPEDSLLFISSDIPMLSPLSTRVSGNIIDISPYNHTINCNNGVVGTYRPFPTYTQGCQDMYISDATLSGIYQGTSSIDFHSNGESYLSTDYTTNLCLGDEWTIHCFSYFISFSSTQLINISTSTQRQVSLGVNSTGYLICYVLNTAYVLSNYALQKNRWYHLALIRKNEWLYGFIDGERQPNGVYYPTSFSTSPCAALIGTSFDGYMDLVVVESKANWKENFNCSNKLDCIYGFKILNESILNVEFNIVEDANSPKLIDVSPLRNTLDFCPDQSIIFDVLDDYTGINWSRLNVEIDGDLLIQNGQDISSRVGRGLLSWESRGTLDGEWVSYGPCTVEELSEPVEEDDKLFVNINALAPTYCEPMVSGINRTLYPPGTVYPNSGAWGYRFTYSFNPNELPYNHNIVVKVWGEDNYLEPNLISDQYSIYTITNENIQSDNFFVPVGESTTIYDFSELTCDFYDVDYPITDLITASSYLIRSDGLRTETCSGIYWTTRSGISYPIYTLHYKPEDYFRWDTERKTTYEVTIVNNNSYCYVERKFEFIIKPGWRIYWDHKNYRYPLTDRTYNPFAYDSNISIFVLIKNNTFMPNKLLESCTFHIVKPSHKDLYVTLDPKITHKDLTVNLKPHTPYLEYGELVECIIECEDMAGNSMSYTWYFRTEDNPNN